MPYKRTAYKKGGRGLSKTQRVEVKKLVQAPMEKKRYPIYKQNQGISVTHFVDDLMSIAQGDGEQDRDGDQIKVTSGFLRGAIYGADTTNIVRATVIRWKPSSVPTAADIYDATSIGTNGALFSPFNHAKRQDFVVLADRFWHLTNDTYGHGDRIRQFFIKIRSQPKTVYDGTSTVYATNKLYIIWSSDSTVATYPDVVYRGDIHYTDC